MRILKRNNNSLLLFCKPNSKLPALLHLYIFRKSAAYTSRDGHPKETISFFKGSGWQHSNTRSSQGSSQSQQPEQHPAHCLLLCSHQNTQCGETSSPHTFQAAFLAAWTLEKPFSSPSRNPCGCCLVPGNGLMEYLELEENISMNPPPCCSWEHPQLNCVTKHPAGRIMENPELGGPHRDH